ncbi:MULTISPECIES: PLP-dependent aminotransferase family protein [unclassified Leptolyngbya]|uniref:aminotransferase-like domain-containing protein n=1 Tax=unclassified Leptolyngbya TaxID=2650499 RepID=UPI001682317E|nr:MULTISPECIES: PLP-dependent aminotransferase family protein [unclassified Leptolyngbya]MBD1910815.1 PLP-dependent aminotransferase family protein [Leptolyngbya sp. FACHB-8]MBD2157616.1 PLP-dependent aminotransferase family protein [Leptolyngbya sp. FACHB-16]
MKIPVDRDAEEPVYLQIRDRISHLINSGGLRPGDRLPSIREMARNVNVNKLTVIEAYSVLEADGLIYARQGAGYFINTEPLTRPRGASTFAPDQQVIIPPNEIPSFLTVSNAVLRAEAQPGTIRLSSGFPQPTGIEDVQRIARRAVKNVADALFRHNHPQGEPALRSQIAQLLMQLGLAVKPDDLLVTNGSLQALALITQHFIQPGDWVVVESPTFHGYLSILQQAGARVIGIPMTAEGMNLDLLEQYLQSHHPKLIYTISTLHNPTGITTSLAHRRRLLDLAERYNCRVVEDNAYERLNFEPTPPPIKAMDESDRVIYIGTFSKTLMPALRVGYAMITGEHNQALIERKMLHDMHVSVMSQAIISEYLASGHYRRRLNQLLSLNQQNRCVMLRALETHFPAEASWTVPIGGVFLWVQLPPHISVQRVAEEAAAQKVLVGTGTAFFPDQQGYPALRLGYAESPEHIERGIEIVGRILKAQ